MPASVWALARAWLFWTLWPMLNRVARTPAFFRAASRLLVLLAFGPSSNVRAT
jgi:hypothetical protein